ncbi:polysaccharide pyruvyl transferase CsaB [Microcoleus sp. FACHB-1515]|uniref:polysaccharide pyruvyl transferase CsaB n=1 Tax=Cyanophyceae TaxID=3028117 RepID=UPI0016862C01|nr:polysaccharide pyruvyl transferase CsaB [Microcoleus sp. FACHB-1515]MBD2091752.1 polysaccharide pyruvyl transferase CsaB [Microcoleus sp. FACHB-1515]
MKAVLCGYYGKGNGGDEALLASLLQMLPATIDPIVLSGNPTQTQIDYGVEAIDRMSPIAVVNALRRSQLFIWGGGSLMQDTTSALSPIYYGGLMRLAQQMGLKTIAWAQGIGPLKRDRTRWLARQTFANCTAVSVRDSGSAALLSEWKIDFTIAPDPVWALESASVPGLWDLPAPRVAVSLRPHSALTSDRLFRLSRALRDFQQATQTCILLIPFQASQDMAIAQTLQAEIPNSHILSLSNPQQLKGVFQGVEMAIAMRLHGLIMAAAAECRCFAISYDPKVKQLMQELDLPGWSIDALPADADEMTSIWLDQYANGDALSLDQIGSLVDRAQMHGEVLKQAIA